MEFISSTTFWLLSIPAVIIFGTATITSMHPKILERNPTALALNNLMMILGIGFLVAVFVVHSWLAGVTCLILSIISMGITARVRERVFLKQMVDQAKGSTEQPGP